MQGGNMWNGVEKNSHVTGSQLSQIQFLALLTLVENIHVSTLLVSVNAKKYYNV